MPSAIQRWLSPRQGTVIRLSLAAVINLREEVTGDGAFHHLSNSLGAFNWMLMNLSVRRVSAGTVNVSSHSERERKTALTGCSSAADAIDLPIQAGQGLLRRVTGSNRSA